MFFYYKRQSRLEDELSYSDYLDLKNEVDEEWGKLCADPEFVSTVVRGHYRWCVAHGKEEESLAIPMRSLFAIQKKFPDCKKDKDFRENDSYFIYCPYSSGSVIESFSDLMTLDEGCLADALVDEMGICPKSIEEIYDRYDALIDYDSDSCW